MAVNLSLIPSKTRKYSLIVSASQDAGGYAIFRENNLELLLGYRLNELFYIGMPVVRTDGRAVGRCTVTCLPNFLGWVVYHIFFACESSAMSRCYKIVEIESNVYMHLLIQRCRENF